MRHLRLYETYNVDNELTIGDVLYKNINDIEIIIDYNEDYVWRVDTKIDVLRTKTGIILGNIYLGETKLINIVEFLENNPKYIDLVHIFYEEGEKGHGDFYTLYDEWQDNKELQILFEAKKYNI